MLCILRVSGTALDANDLTAVTNLKPFRADPSCMHYEVAVMESGDWAAFVDKIAHFLSENEPVLEKFNRMGAITDKRPDIAAFFRTDQVMKTLELGTALLSQVVHLGLAVEFSIYSTETQPDNRTDAATLNQMLRA